MGTLVAHDAAKVMRNEAVDEPHRRSVSFSCRVALSLWSHRRRRAGHALLETLSLQFTGFVRDVNYVQDKSICTSARQKCRSGILPAATATLPDDM